MVRKQMIGWMGTVCAMALTVAGCVGAGGGTTMGGGAPIAAEESFSAGPFTVAAGAEIVMCSYVRGTNDAEEDITRFNSTQSIGGHHIIVYAVDHPVDLAPARCSQGGQPGWSQILASSLPEEETAFPAGVGFHVKARQQYVLETHFINTSSADTEVKSGFTAHYAGAGTVKQRASTYYIGTGNVDVAPNGTTSTTVTCKPPSTIDLKTMFGHEHRYGTGVTVDLIPASGGAVKPLYSTTEWENPGISDLGGGQSVGTDDAIRVKCDWNNTSSDTLGYPHEMCFAIGYFWPATASLMCASGGGSDTCVCWYPDSVATGPGGGAVEVTVSRAETIAGTLKGDVTAGDPIYVSLFRAADWGAAGPLPGAQPVYYRSRIDAPLKAATDAATFVLADVTPGDYVVSSYMDTVHGGFVAGSGDALNSVPVAVKAVAGQTAKASVTLDFALP